MSRSRSSVQARLIATTPSNDWRDLYTPVETARRGLLQRPQLPYLYLCGVDARRQANIANARTEPGAGLTETAALPRPSRRPPRPRSGRTRRRRLPAGETPYFSVAPRCSCRHLRPALHICSLCSSHHDSTLSMARALLSGAAGDASRNSKARRARGTRFHGSRPSVFSIFCTRAGSASRHALKERAQHASSRPVHCVSS